MNRNHSETAMELLYVFNSNFFAINWKTRLFIMGLAQGCQRSGFPLQPHAAQTILTTEHCDANRHEQVFLV